MNDPRDRLPDPFLSNYQPSDLRIASEFLTTWLPFLSRDLCPHCTQTLSRRVRSLDLGCHGDRENSDGHNRGNIESDAHDDDYVPETVYEDNCETNSIGTSKVSAEKNILNGVNGSPEHFLEASTSEGVCETPSVESFNNRMSWADMAQEDELEEVEDQGSNEKDVYSNDKLEEENTVKVPEKPKLSREQRENIRFMNVKRNKEFRCYEKINNKLINILEGLELHTGIFSAAEQKRIVNFVYSLQEMGKRGELKARTYSAPRKWMRGKGRVTIQFGCCYNYVVDKNGNPPGILQNEMVDPIPDLFKVIIRRLVKWHVLPPTCVPDSCIVNIYEEGDCIPPHIDNHDFVRPFCTVSFLSECNIVFGTNIEILGAGEFAGSYSISLPVGSVLVLNGNGADVAKHCVPAVPTKRISITFRRMDESKHPVGYHPEPDLQGIQPLAYQVDKPTRSNERKPDHHRKRSTARRENKVEERGSTVRNSNEPWQVPQSRRRYRVNLGN